MHSLFVPDIRFIPVYTGNILCIKLPTFIFTVYPCVYREHHLRRINSKTKYGLSLCIQGTYDISRFVISNARFIPVYTGNIMPNCFLLYPSAVYPCVYREHKIDDVLSMFYNVYPCVYREHTNYNILFYN